jgi:hypothetical protein
MERPNTMDVNVQTGEQVVRPMNDEEFAQYQIDLAQVTPK